MQGKKFYVRARLKGVAVPKVYPLEVLPEAEKRYLTERRQASKGDRIQLVRLVGERMPSMLIVAEYKA